MSKIRSGRGAALVAACALAWLWPEGAWAQSTDTFRGAQPFPGTVRDQLRDDLAKTSGQLYGAIGTLERQGVLHMVPGEFIAASETNIIAGALRIPGTSKYGTIGDTSARGMYQMLPADVFSFSAVFALRFENFGIFASGGAVYPRVSDGTEAAIGRTMFPMIGVLATPLAHLGVAAAPFLTGATKVVGDQKSADIFSYVYGGFFDAGPMVLYAGLVGTGRGAGLYTNISQNRIRFLAESVLSEKFTELTYLKAGLSQLPGVAKLFSGELPEPEEKREKRAKEDRTLTSLYGRKVVFSIPRRGADAVEIEPGRLGFWSLHAEQANIGQIFDAALAAGVYPSPVLHEARVGVHTTGFYSPDDWGVGVSGGMVRLPALYMLAEQPGGRFAFRAEARGGPFSLAILRNQPELLSAFPYAYDAWAFNFTVNIAQFLDK